MEGFDGSGGTGSLGLGAMAGGQSAAPAVASSGGAGATASRQKPSRGIGIGIGVAAGAATAHRGMKRELSDSNLGGAAGWDGNDSGWAGMGGDARRSMSEQQKLERRVSVLMVSICGRLACCMLGCWAVTFTDLCVCKVHELRTEVSTSWQLPNGRCWHVRLTRSITVVYEASLTSSR